jgi:hypothetical protein
MIFFNIIMIEGGRNWGMKKGNCNLMLRSDFFIQSLIAV